MQDEALRQLATLVPQLDEDKQELLRLRFAAGLIFQQEVGLSHVEQAGLSQEIDLSQTVDSITLTLERGYADINRIVLGYTIHTADSRRYDPYSMRLSDANGVTLLLTIGMGVSGQSDVMDISLPPGERGYVFSFDATDLQGIPSTLDLHLEVELREFLLLAERERAVAGPFTSDFDLLLSPGYTNEVQQNIEAAGVALELKRIVVTPSKTRVFLCIEAPGDEWKHWAVVAKLSTEGGWLRVHGVQTSRAAALPMVFFLHSTDRRMDHDGH
jgi:hypothetical protein